MLDDDQAADAVEIAEHLAEAVEGTQGRAYAVHLRGLQRRRPDLEGLQTIITLFSGDQPDTTDRSPDRLSPTEPD